MVTGGEIRGFPNLGPECAEMVDVGGGPMTDPATSIMTMMLTSQDGDWKCPMGYFVISGKFKGPGNMC